MRLIPSWDYARCADLAESDILSPETAAAMETRQPRLGRVDVSGVGHAPTLAEPIAVAALDAFYLVDAARPRPSP